MMIRDIDLVVEYIKSYDTISNEISQLHMDCGINVEMHNTVEGKKWCCQFDSHPMNDHGVRDRTPSCTTNDEKGLFYCFAESVGGNIITYAKNLLHIDTVEAIYRIAKACCIDISQFEREPTAEEIKRNKLMQVNKSVCSATCNNIPDHVLDYLYDRGITNDSIDEYGIGYCPPLVNGNTVFVGYDYSYELQLGRRDMFNDAILFPICDAYGNILYYRSRPFNSITGAKYIGANDSHPLFDPCRIFGFDIARRKLSGNKKLILTEGEFDTIALNQCDYPSVAVLGSTISQELFDLFDAYKIKEVVLFLDGDKTGRSKTLSNCKKYLTFKTDVVMKVALCKEDCDPNDLIMSGEDVGKYLSKPIYAIQYIIDSFDIDTSTPTGKIDYISSTLEYVNMVSNKTIKDVMIQYIANIVNMDYRQVVDYFVENKNCENVLYNIHGEEVLLGEVLRDKDFIHRIEFKEEDWYLFRHKQLFHLFKTVDDITLDSIATTAKNLQIEDINMAWLQHLVSQTGDVEFALKDIEDKIIRRNAIDVFDKAKMDIANMSNDAILNIDKYTTSLYEVAHRKTDKHITTAKTDVDETMQLIFQRMKNPSKMIGYSWGKNFQKMNSYTLGIAPQTLNIVSANQSVGKSTITMCFALDLVLNQNVPVLWFSLEMSSTAMTFRNFANVSGVMADKIMTGNLNAEELQAVQQGALRLRNAPLYISESGHDLSEALATAKRYVQAHNVKVIVIDYLQLQVVTDRKTDTRSRELGTISKEWKQFAMENDVSVILISQLGRQALSKDIAGAEDGFGSYEVAQDADIYITLKDKSEEEINERGLEHGNITLNISKNRNGQKTVLLDIYHHGGLYRMEEV